jgi:hypothetical protein
MFFVGRYANCPRASICFLFKGWRPFGILLHLIFFNTVRLNDKFTSHNYVNVICIYGTGGLYGSYHIAMMKLGQAGFLRGNNCSQKR